MNTEVNAKALLALLNQRELPEFKTLPQVCSFVTEFLMKKYNLKQPTWINEGYCFIWAYLVWALWRQQNLTFVSSEGHVVIYDGTLYYDAANSQGYLTLDEAEVDADAVADLGIKGMAWYWARCGLEKTEFRKILRKTYMPLYKVISKGGMKIPADVDNLSLDDIPYPLFA